MASPRQQSSIAGEGYGLSKPIWISLWADADLDSCFPLGCQMQSSMTDEWMSDSVQQRDPRMAGGGGGAWFSQVSLRRSDGHLRPGLRALPSASPVALDLESATCGSRGRCA